MKQKAGRNDPCPCGSGKKYKACCIDKDKPKPKGKLTAKWLNAPAGPDLMEKTFGEAMQANRAFTQIKNKETKTEEGESA